MVPLAADFGENDQAADSSDFTKAHPKKDMFIVAVSFKYMK